MNQDDIIRMVRASAVEIYGPMPDEKMYDIFIERCARLIDMGCIAAVAAEREQCAKVCDAKVDAEYATGKVDHNEMGWTQACAIAIRARGQA
jgi:hypothetical protein